MSDTHGHVSHALKAAQVFETFEVEAVLHCGDIGSTEIPPLMESWPTHYVLGNVDRQEERLAAAIETAGGILHGRFGSLTAAGRKISFLHGDDVTRLNAEIESGAWDILCYGHTHHANQYRKGKTLVLNPGALRRTRSPSIAVVHLEPMLATIVPLE